MIFEALRRSVVRWLGGPATSVPWKGTGLTPLETMHCHDSSGMAVAILAISPATINANRPDKLS